MPKTNKPMKAKTTVLAILGILACSLSAMAEAPKSDSSPAQAPAATTYQFRNLKFGELLRPQDANGANGTRIVLYSAQPWKCMTWRLQPAGESAFHVQNLFTAKTFAADAKSETDQQAVVQVPMKKDASEIPTWAFTKLEDGSYKITDPKSGKALTAVKGGKDYQIKIVVEAWQNQDEQKWELQKMDPNQLTM